MKSASSISLLEAPFGEREVQAEWALAGEQTGA
jgi:hypothetical protein